MIYDTQDNPLTAASLSVTASQTQIFTIRVECRSGYFLRSETAADLTVEARRVGDAAWIDLETSQIDLSAWNATRQNFELRLTAANLPQIAIKNFSLKVEP